jgi:hypothetical protein
MTVLIKLAFRPVESLFIYKVNILKKSLPFAYKGLSEKGNFIKN